MVTVSWILPVYNGARYLQEAVESVLAQTFGDFELIVIDDGSTDGTPEVLARLAAADPRIVPVRQPNGGIVAALNEGLRLSRGRFIARMDADDVCLPDRLEKQLAYLEAHPDCVLVGGEALEFYDDGRIGRQSTGGRHRRTNLGAFPPKVAVAVHPLVVMRREALEAAGGYRPFFPHAEDYDLFIRLGRLGSIDSPPGVVLKYRRHEEAVSLRNLHLQERSAAMAEACAIHEERHGPVSSAEEVEAACRQVWPNWLTDAYVSFRIWRRLNNLPERPDGWSPLSIVPALFALTPTTLLSSDYWSLRIRIIGSMVRSFAGRRPAPAAAPAAP